ncbi:hypothetical protein HBI29_156940 [Parastagonospora nodorum]|nr:hypothetical protein HBI29_156940 [Parastagonospora nodorum]KAH5651141.1 hypothetical protein HBI51_087370 [Parastagonospora nodorum]
MPRYSRPQDRNLPGIQTVQRRQEGPKGRVWRDFNAKPAVGGWDEEIGEHWGDYNKGPADQRQ